MVVEVAEASEAAEADEVMRLQGFLRPQNHY